MLVKICDFCGAETPDLTGTPLMVTFAGQAIIVLNGGLGGETCGSCFDTLKKEIQAAVLSTLKPWQRRLRLSVEVVKRTV